MTVGSLVETARSSLSESALMPSKREAYLLLGHALGLSEAQVIARWADEVPEERAREFGRLLERRLAGEPMAYLVGGREFYGRWFRVDNRVLIPRPESEHLIEAVLGLALPERPRVLDLGAGSGCLAITLALEIPSSRVTAVDVSPAALAVAARNARELCDPACPDRPRFVAGDLARSLDLARFDLVVSNPPYVDPEDRAKISREVLDFEPHRALFPPGEATSAISRLVTELAALPAGAHLVFEIGDRQLARVERMLERSAFELLEVVADYQAIPRTVVARRS